MKTTPHTLARLAPLLAALLGLGAPVAWGADEDAARKDLVLTGDAACTRCHDESEHAYAGREPEPGVGEARPGVIQHAAQERHQDAHGHGEKIGVRLGVGQL